MKRLFFLSVFFTLSMYLFAQPSNDDCNGATNLGTLGAPANCGSGIKNGATTTQNGTLVGSTPENPYTTLAGCNMASPANSVWYKFTAPAKGYGVNINISNATFNNPNVALWQGNNCSSLSGVGCKVGTGNSVTLNISNGIVPGQTYYIQVTSNSINDFGTFTLNVYAYQDCSQCLNASTLTVTPLPVNGTYQPGQTVKFCFHVDQWTQVSNNWLHGIQINGLGNGWDLTTIVAGTPPAPSYVSCGNWKYYPNGIPGNNVPGFYFDGNPSPFGGCNSLDNNPSNNFGDGTSNNGLVITPGPNQWKFCFSIKVKAGCNPGQSLSLSIDPTGDGETGNWSSLGCTNDGVASFNAIIACCPPTMSSTPSCATGSTGTATATPVGTASPYSYNWSGPSGYTNSSSNVSGANTITGLAPGTYNVTVTDKNLCASIGTITVGSTPAPTVTVNNSTICNGQSATVTATPSTGGGTYSWNTGATTQTLNVSPSSTTTYTVTYTLNGCPSNPASGTVTVNPVPTVSVNSGTICTGQSFTLTATVSPTGGTYSWNTGATTQSITVSPTSTTTYNVTYTAGGCTNTGSGTVTVSSTATVSITQSGPYCITDAAVNLVASPSGGTWSGTGITNAGNGTFDPATAGTGTHSITYTVGGACGGTDTKNFVVTNQQTATINPAGPYCATASPVTLTVTGTQGGTWSGTGITNASTGTFDPATAGAGTHTITYTISGSCGSTTTANITVNTQSTANIDAAGPFCSTDSPVNLTVTGTQGGVWSGTGITNASAGTFDPATAGAGTHTITYTISGSCGTTDTENIVASNNQNASINPAGPFCSTQSPPTNLTVTGSQGGTWSGNGITNATNGTFDPSIAGAGTHSISYSLPGSCGSTTKTNIQVDAPQDPTINPAGPFCASDPSITLTAASSGGTWSGEGITNTSTGTFDPATAGNGTHIITYTISGVCITSDTVLIDVSGVAITNVATTNISCNGVCDGSITITASGATQYSIDNGTTFQAGNSFTGLCANTYNIVAKGGAAACQATATATITQPQPLTFSFSTTNATCAGKCDGSATAIVSGGTSPYSYSWLPSGSTANSATGICAGTYTFKVTDNNGCFRDTTFTITEPAPFNVSQSSSPSNCGQPDGVASVTVTGASPPYNYAWSNGGPNSPFISNATNGTYYVTITDSKNCTYVDSIIVGYNPPPTVTATSTPANCKGSCTGTATANAIGGTTPGQYTYQWGFNANGQTGQTAVALCAGTYSVTVMDGNNCSATTSVVVTEPTKLITTASNDTTICIGKTANLYVSSSGGTPPYTFSWSNSTAGSGPNSVSPTTNTCYYVTSTDSKGCTAVDTTCVFLFPALSTTTSPTQFICKGGSATLTAQANGGNGQGYTYTWYNGGVQAGTGSSIVVQPAGNYPSVITYMVVVSDNCSPNDTDYVDVSFYEEPSVQFSPDSTFGCNPLTVTFVNTTNNSTAPFTNCQWDLGNGIVITGCDSVQHTFPTGDYTITLTLTSKDGCVSNSNPGYVSVAPNPLADFTFNPMVTTVQNMEINFFDQSSGNINSWLWEFFNQNGSLMDTSQTQNPIYNFASTQTNPFIYYLTDTGTYPVTLTVSTIYGCKDDTTLYVKVGGVFYVNVPNAFTPNGDGINDYFFPSGVGFYPDREYKLQIFDRWGDLIFESHRLDDPWDGTAREPGGTKPVKQDVYVWKLEVKDFTLENEVHKYLGHVTLLRRD